MPLCARVVLARGMNGLPAPSKPHIRRAGACWEVVTRERAGSYVDGAGERRTYSLAGRTITVAGWGDRFPQTSLAVVTRQLAKG